MPTPPLIGVGEASASRTCAPEFGSRRPKWAVLDGRLEQIVSPRVVRLQRQVHYACFDSGHPTYINPHALAAEHGVLNRFYSETLKADALGATH